jgi:hypothetical protein
MKPSHPVRPCFQCVEKLTKKAKDLNIKNLQFIIIQNSHFNQKTKIFFVAGSSAGWRAEEPRAAQNFVDIMVKIHNKIQNIKTLGPK